MSNAQWHDVGTGPCVVLLHAFPCDHRMWDQQSVALVKAGWRVLTPDLPGFAGTPLPDGSGADESLAIVVDGLHADLVDLGVDRFVLVGLSLGGYLTMEWLRRHPEAVAAVAFCDTKATADASSAVEGRLAMAAEVEAAPESTAAILRDRMWQGIVGTTTRASRPDVLDQLAQWLEEAPAATIAWYQRAMAARQDSRETLASISVPALVIWGVEDTMSARDEQLIMIDALRDGELVEIPDAGHLSAIENPAAVTAALIDFLAAVRGSTLQG